MARRLDWLAALGVALAAAALLRGQVPVPQPPVPAVPQPPVEAPQPPVTFRAEVNYVEVDVRVLDAQGRFVTALTPTDFQVFEDGKPQKVTVFSVVNIPVERVERPLFASKPIERDVRSNLEGANGRIYLLVLDDLHTNALRSQRVKAAARQFIERYLSANDLAAVVFTGGPGSAAQDFTNNTRLLLNAVDRFMGRKVRSATLNRIDEEFRTREFRQQGDRINDPEEFERAYQARTTLESIASLATYLGSIRGRRKALVLFSEGIDYDITDVFNNREATTILEETRDAISAATRANVAIYGVDPRGLGGLAEEQIEVQSFPDDTTLGLNQTSFYNEVRLAQDSLRTLSDETGGFAVVNRNDFAAAFQRIVDDNSSYYLLGYYSGNDRRDGRFRRIDVRLPGRPDLTVRARRGYAAPRGRTPEPPKIATGPNSMSPELRDAMESPLPLTGLPMAMTAAVFKGPAPKGAVVVSALVGGAGLSLVETDGTFRNDIEVLVVATDDKGKSFPTDRYTANLNMRPDTAARVKSSGVRIISSLDLPPGRYQLRVGARERNTRRAGSVTYDIEVPDFAKPGLAMSSIALTSALSGLAPTVRPKDPLEKILPGPLSAYREFPQQDELAFFAEVYDNVGRQPHKVILHASVNAEGGQTVFQTTETRESAELAGSAGGYGFAARIPLKDIAPGLYVLRVEATSTMGDPAPVAREVVFRVLGAR